MSPHPHRRPQLATSSVGFTSVLRSETGRRKGSCVDQQIRELLQHHHALPEQTEATGVTRVETFINPHYTLSNTETEDASTAKSQSAGVTQMVKAAIRPILPTDAPRTAELLQRFVFCSRLQHMQFLVCTDLYVPLVASIYDIPHCSSR